MILSLLVILCISLITLHIATRYNRCARLLLKIPGPKPLPIFGNLLMVKTSDLPGIWSRMRQIAAEYYPISALWSITYPVINLCHPDDVQIVLSSQSAIEKSHLYGILHPWLKTGLITSGGDKWRQRRKMLTPAFHYNILKKYQEIINEETKREVNSLKSESKETNKSLVSYCSKHTLNVICEAAMGIRMSEMDVKVSDNYRKAVHDYASIFVYRMLRPFIMLWMIPFVYNFGTFHQNTLKILHVFTEKVIKKRIDYHENSQNRYLKDLDHDLEEDSSETIGINQKKRLSMLDLLLKEKLNGLIDYEGIKEEVDTFTFAGHDTMSMSLTYTLLLLAENKEAQDRARAEATELLDRVKENITITDLQDLLYLERCIKESLRLFPPAATLVRCLSDDLQLKHAFLPAGTNVAVHLYDTHRDPNFWPDPEKFDPDRFLPENVKNRHPFSYVPFSAGPRNCIGQKFAMMEMKSIIARLLYDFYVEPIDRLADLRLQADLVIKPAEPIRVKFIRIDK